MVATIYADFNNLDERGRIRLNADGTIADLQELSLSLEEGQTLTLSDGELEVTGIVEFSTAEQIWVARINLKAIHER